MKTATAKQPKIRPIKWKTTKKDSKLITEIVKREVAMCRLMGMPSDPMTIRMDITATHLNGCKLDLQKLLKADDFNFAHDVCGIARHIDRNTGKLTRFFVPRCSAPSRHDMD